MNTSINDTLYKRVKDRGFVPAHVAEVGVHEPESSNILQYIQDGVRATLVEPEPEAVQHIQAHFKHRSNVTLHACAICDFEGQIELVKNGPSTFVGALPASPALINDGFVPEAHHKFNVPAKRMEQVDDGSMELLSIDTEGSEWYVIKNMVSRPRVLSIEMHGAAYVNPFYQEIMAWIKKEGYTTWYKTKTDSVFVRKADWTLSMADRLQLAVMNARIALRRARKTVFKRPAS